MNDRIGAISSWYGSDDPGTQTNLARPTRVRGHRPSAVTLPLPPLATR